VEEDHEHTATPMPDRDRSAEVDEAYTAYDRQPYDEPDDWGDLATFRLVAAAT
jgi:hypothetical protein